MALSPKRTLCHREFPDKSDHQDMHGHHGHHGFHGHHRRHGHCHQRHHHGDHQKTDGDSNDFVTPIVEGTETKQA